MNTNKIKSYAPKARRDFIEAVTRRAAKFGITEKEIAPAEEKGELVLIKGEAFPKKIGMQRRKLEETIQRQGFQQTMEAIAYTWFNRLAAIRYMELHGYLDCGYRMLSHPEGKVLPEILEHAEHVDLPGLDKDKVIELKLDGTKDEELYRDLLLAQCHALYQAMPFLFEAIDDETELLLPDNLTQTDSLIRELVTEIPEEDWQEVEIIGWLYQFYISEKKDQVIGKVVKSEDIPAATQLFTPNWIVKYMVQNSLGAQWLATYPESKLKAQMEYYIEPAEQTDEVKSQLVAITPSSLNPEELTLIDPACGSGHILVEAYELFKAIYLERGYRQRDVPQLILEKNLFGLDIDERAAQLTGFALMMKGRADDRRLFERGVKLNVMALQDSTEFDAEALAKGIELGDFDLKPGDLTELKRLFEHATTFGSLIQVPEGLAKKLPALKQLSEATSQDLFVSGALKRLKPLVQQAERLAAQYDAVVANPPYMGSGGMNALVKNFAKDQFPDAKSDLLACFIERSYTLARDSGCNAMVTMQSWMFLSSFQKMRERMLREKTISTMAQIGYNSFPSMNSKVAQATVFSLQNRRVGNFTGTFIDLNSAPQSADKKEVFLQKDPANRFLVPAEGFTKIPGSPVAYRTPRALFAAFDSLPRTGVQARAAIGMATADNSRFVREWWEVCHERLGLGLPNRDDARQSGRKWFPYAKGGRFRRWFGNVESVVDWEQDGEAIRNTLSPDGTRVRAHNFNLDRVFREGVSWTVVTTGAPSFRKVPMGHLFDAAAGILQPRDSASINTSFLLAFLNSNSIRLVLDAVNPTLNLHPGYLEALPCPTDCASEAAKLASDAIAISAADWLSRETAFGFQLPPFLSTDRPALQEIVAHTITEGRRNVAEMKRLEEENNRLFIDAYGLADELTPDVPIEQITLTVNPAYRYGGKLTEEEQWTRFRQDTMEELLSYAIGCMMGRYSLDAPGLIYAHSGNEGFEPTKYTTFPADDDGIVPLTDTEWFDDDAANRLVRFVSVAWDVANLEENLKYVADNLSSKKSETSRETIRRYLGDKFFKDHLQTYKKRPIYWLFSSGKQKAFQCLVYLHRYNEGTLSRMRMEYVVPLQSKLSARIDQLDGDITSASSTANRNKLQKEKDKLVKQREELTRFDEKLRHYADQRISLDLDDGVKVNYGKFDDLLADVKAVTGKKQ